MENTKKKIKRGTVLRRKMDKTAVVEVTRAVMDSEYKKYVRRKKKFLVHDEKNECNSGDIVEIVECRPISKRKSWRIKRIIEHAKIPEEVKLDDVELEGQKKRILENVSEV